MSDPEKPPSHEEMGQPQLETGPYILRSLIKDVQLSESGDSAEDVRITCVEAWREHLYIGTSAGEILHHFRIPPDPSAPDDGPSYIPAMRLRPPVNQLMPGAGIQQMLLLPAVSKICVLGSNTLNFYTLPELAPAFPQLKPLTCGWVGGVDLNDDVGQDKPSVAIMMCLRNKIRLVDIGETGYKKLRDIEFGSCLATVRRGSIACVADSRSYALVDVVAQQKIPLLPISSSESPPSPPSQAPEDAWPGAAGGHSRSSSVATERLGVQDKGHGRSTSLGMFRTESPLGDSPRNSMTSGRHGFDVGAAFKRQISPRPTEDRRPEATPDVMSKPLPPPPEEGQGKGQSENVVVKTSVHLGPVITSPNENEFLLVTGTAPSDPGLGMFVNLEGDIVRGTMEFSSFPEAMVTDGRGIDLSVSSSGLDETQEEGYVLSIVHREAGGVISKDVEIQRWDVDPTQNAHQQTWLGLACDGTSATLGIRRIVEDMEYELPVVVEKLAQQAIRLSSLGSNSNALANGDNVTKRQAEERAYYQRMATTKTGIVVWTASEVHWTIRNPLLLRLDAQLRHAECMPSVSMDTIAPQRRQIESLLNHIRGQRSQTELEFYTLAYIRQKAALLLFLDLVLQTASNNLAFEVDKRTTEEAILESEIDPRFVLHFLPGISGEVLVAGEGVWVQGGIHSLLTAFMAQWDASKISTDPHGPFGENLLKVVKRFLLIWRRRRGNPSVVDGEHVFPTVDAALLRILLILDQDTPQGPATAGSVRAELNAVVDSGVECFERAVDLLEDYKRLYVLSRLYQSKKNAAKVLETWRRIISGEEDLGGEFAQDGEMELKNYLTKLRNRALVEEYGTWLAARNPKLGVQVFADDHSRTTWATSDALDLLRDKAPAAVKEYLEYLVFSKKQAQHINELIAYYLDIVVSALEIPESGAKDTLRMTYETYRALQAPKPTYKQFIEENAVGEEWWDSRLRLLQLLGKTQGEGAGYDVELVLKRLQLYEDALVPEMIILSGRQGLHEKAIRLLTHGLGDFDMAISYCLRGGYSSSSPASTSTTTDHQRPLFTALLHAYLALPDLTSRIERTSELLERFGAWFDAGEVLNLVPEAWSVESVGGFFVGALGRLVAERNEGRVVRALWGARNLGENVRKIELIEEKRPVTETERGFVGGEVT